MFPSVSSPSLFNTVLNSPNSQAAQKPKSNPEDIDFSGFMKILMTKITHQSPLSSDGDPLDIMSELSQMTVAKNSLQQVDQSKKILEELQNIKNLLPTECNHKQLEGMQNQIHQMEKQLSHHEQPLNRALEGIQLADKLIKSIF